MKVIVELGKGISRTDDLEKRIGNYFLRLERKLSSLPEAMKRIWVRVDKRRGIYHVQSKMKVGGELIVVEKQGDRLIGVVTEVRDDLERRFKRMKR